MIPQKSIQPMELVISAIHCLKEKKGSSPKNIIRFLEEKYDVCGEVLKTEVENGLRRGVSFGLINQKSGLYRLNDILRSPLRKAGGKLDKICKAKYQKSNVGLKRRKLGKLYKKTKKNSSANRKKKGQNSKNGRKNNCRKLMKGQALKRQNDIRRRNNLKRRKYKAEKAQKFDAKMKKIPNDNEPDNDSSKNVNGTNTHVCE